MALLNLRDVASSAGTAPPLHAGRLFRSGQPFRLSADDIAPIEGRVDMIVDLRDPHEAHPGEWALMEERGARVLHIPLAGQVLAMDPIAGSGDNPLGVFYVAMLDHCMAPFAEVARAVAGSDGVLLHCAAGKDRTGVATALMLDLIGVPRGPIIADYERTNAAMGDVIAQLAAAYGEIAAGQGNTQPTTTASTRSTTARLDAEATPAGESADGARPEAAAPSAAASGAVSSRAAASGAVSSRAAASGAVSSRAAASSAVSSRAAASGAVSSRAAAPGAAAPNTAASSTRIDPAKIAEAMSAIPPQFLTAPADAIELFLSALAERGGGREYLRSAGLENSELDALSVRLIA